MSVHEDEHSRESVRRAPEHGTGDHFAGTRAQTRGDPNSAHARAQQVTVLLLCYPELFDFAQVEASLEMTEALDQSPTLRQKN